MGQEIKRAKDDGKLMPPHVTRRRPGHDLHHEKVMLRTLAEVGIGFKQSAAFQRVALLSEAAIHAAVEKANEERRTVSKAEIRRARSDETLMPRHVTRRWPRGIDVEDSNVNPRPAGWA